MTTFLLETNPLDTGSAYYLVFFDASGQCWNGAAYVAYTTTRDTFDVPMTEVVAGTGVYSVAMPALPAGFTQWSYYKRSGGSPSLSADVRYKTGSGYCDGSNMLADCWGDVLEAGFTANRLLRIVAAAVAGKVTGEPGSPVFRNLADNTNMISGTADSNGNRSTATYGS